MAELTFPVSPGVVTREIDLSGPTQVGPTGVPAGVIGTAVRGPAFVPVTVATFQDFISVFGNSDGKKHGPMAMREWLRNAGAGTFVRVLGVGDGTARKSSGDNAGRINNAGFVVGQELPKENGLQGANTFTGEANTNGPLGRTYGLVCLMSESAGNTRWSDAGMYKTTSQTAWPILRGVLMAPSGVVLALSSTLEGNNSPPADSAAFDVFGAAKDGGAPFGTIDTSNGQFVLLINGLKNSDQYSNILTASMKPEEPNYFVNVFNTDPTKIQSSGHYLYAHYDVSSNLAVVTGSGLITDEKRTPDEEEAVWLLNTTQNRNVGTVTDEPNSEVGVPNFENFEDRFSSAFSPFVVSQKFGSSNTNLFRFHTLSDGAIGSGEFKITIENIKASSKAGNKYGTFDVAIRRFMDNDLNPEVVESFRGCSLDKTSDNYIAKRIGNRNTFFDFDAAKGSQKIVSEGGYANVSNFIRVAISEPLKNGSVDASALPTGFRGLHHLVTSGTADGATSIFSGSYSFTDVGRGWPDIEAETLKCITQPPVPLREDISTGVTPRKNVQNAFTWGVQFENKTSNTEPNKEERIDSSLLSFSKYFPNFMTSIQNAWSGDNTGVADVGGSILDADRFNKNFFSLERIEVITGSNDRPNPQQWAAAKYRRNGVQVGTLTDRDGTDDIGSRLLDPSKDFSHVPTQKYLKFTFPMIGGNDGVNSFDKEKSKISTIAIRREMLDPDNQGGKDGPSVAAYRKAVDLMEAKQDVDIQLLAIPGIRHPAVTDYAIEATERRFDALFIMDIEEKDEVDSFITGSVQVPSVVNTINRFAGRALDTSFAAAYYPDIVISDPATRTNVKAPPSTVVLGAFALNDAVAFPWYAPAGFTRGALSSALYPGVELLQQNRDDLYTADINPIIGDVTASSGVTVFGQKTLLAAQSALDRVNVRRLLIDVRRKVRNIARTFLFEPNQAATIAAFQAKVSPVLKSIQSLGGLDRFKVIIDTTTTTQADIENNTIRGRIFLQPTRSVEFVSLDFVVSNSI
tara:strand:+ start:1120 stop:4191 length:3072 start_codon:yes stop_codon:yes gene_type:complete